MNVRCSRCGGDYVFDDAKVPPSGVTVKCTSCAHVFKVIKPASDDEPVPLLDTPNVDGWMVRHRDGTVLRFRELTTLQKWIVEQRVSSADEISRTGRTWRPLGDIAELASFFEVVAAANAARRAAELEGARMLEAQSAPPRSPVQEAPLVSPIPPPWETSFSESFDELDDEDPVVAWRKRARRRSAALVLLLVVVGGVAGLFFLARPTFDRLIAGAFSFVGAQSESLELSSTAPTPESAKVEADEPSTAEPDTAREDEQRALATSDDAKPVEAEAETEESQETEETEEKAEAKTEPEVAKADEEAKAASGAEVAKADEGGAADEGPSYDELMRRAEGARIRDRSSTALSLYRQAAAERPRAARPHVGIGWCYLDLDRPRQAADAFAHALTLERDLAEAHFGLAEAMRYSGNKSAALRAYKRYLVLSPSGPDAPIARKAIQSLQESP